MLSELHNSPDPYSDPYPDPGAGLVPQRAGSVLLLCVLSVLINENPVYVGEGRGSVEEASGDN